MNKTITALLLTLSLAGCYKADIPCSVVLMGDSVMQETSGVLGFHLLRRDSAPMLINNSIGGMTTVAASADVYWAERLTNIQAEVDVSYIFVSLGINDINFYRQRPNGVNELWQYMPPAIDGIMNAAGGAEVYWLVPHITLHDSKAAGVEVDVVRQHLAEAAERWNTLHLIYIDDKPEWIDTDYIHLNAIGEQGLALEMIERIR